MPEFERDFVLRQIRMFARAVGRIVAKARDEGQYASGLEALRATMQDGPGKDFALLLRLDPASAAHLVHDGEALSTLAWITAQESALHAGAGDDAAAREHLRRALVLYAECAGRFPGTAAACREAARALIEENDLADLRDEHRRWLDLLSDER